MTIHIAYTHHLEQSHELDQKIQDVYKRIQTERKVLEASQLLRQATTNPDVLRRNDAAIREAERSLSYFEDTLRELQSRKLAQSRRDDHSRSGSTASSQVLLSYYPHLLNIAYLSSPLGFRVFNLWNARKPCTQLSRNTSTIRYATARSHETKNIQQFGSY